MLSHPRYSSSLLTTVQSYECPTLESPVSCMPVGLQAARRTRDRTLRRPESLPHSTISHTKRTGCDG